MCDTLVCSLKVRIDSPETLLDFHEACLSHLVSTVRHATEMVATGVEAFASGLAVCGCVSTSSQKPGAIYNNVDRLFLAVLCRS